MKNNNVDCYLLHGWGVNNQILSELSKDIVCAGNVINPCLYEVTATINNSSFKSIAYEISKNIKRDAILIGWSVGGLIAMQVALLTKKVKAIILIASTPLFVNNNGWDQVIDKKEIDDLKDAFNNNASKTLETFIGLVSFGEESVKNTKKKLQKYITDSKNNETLTDWLIELEDTDLRKAYSMLSIPVLNILGEHDALINPNIIDHLGKLLPKAKHEVIKGCGHAPFINKAQETQNLINNFINATI